MSYDESFRLLSYACAPVLTVAALWGLKQLSISRSIARTQAKREAFRLAAEQCRYYMEVIIPLQNKLDALSSSRRAKMDAIATAAITSKGYSVTFKSPPTSAEFSSDIAGFTDVTNRMESFAAFFISGVAEEHVAFNTVGTTYCNHIKTYLPDLALLDAGNSYYKNLMKLFTLWHTKKEEEKLRKEKTILDDKLRAIGKREIVTIGTN